MARSREGFTSTGLLKGPLLQAPTTVITTPGTAVDAPAVSRKTHFVAIEAVDCNIRYAIRLKSAPYTVLPATPQHTPIPAGAVAIEAVHPGAIISLLQTHTPSGSSQSFLPGYVPVLGL